MSLIWTAKAAIEIRIDYNDLELSNHISYFKQKELYRVTQKKGHIAFCS